MTFNEAELALLAKLGIEGKNVETLAVARAKQRKKKAVSKDPAMRKLCTMRRAVRRVACRTCGAQKLEYWLMKERHYTFWQGEQVEVASWPADMTTDTFDSEIVTCSSCLRMVDGLDIAELRQRLKDMYRLTFGDPVIKENESLPKPLDEYQAQKRRECYVDKNDKDHLMQRIEDEVPSSYLDPTEKWEEEESDGSLREETREMDRQDWGELDSTQDQGDINRPRNEGGTD